jgi:hypothetical protein
MALPSVKSANPTRMTMTIPMGMMKRFISSPGDPTGHTATIGSSSRSPLAVAVRPRLVEIALFRRVRTRCALYHGISDIA